MQKFVVKAIWDEDAKVFYSDSNIKGLHIETESLDEFERVLDEFVQELIFSNHIKPQGMVETRISDLVSTVTFEKPALAVAAE